MRAGSLLLLSPLVVSLGSGCGSSDAGGAPAAEGPAFGQAIYEKPGPYPVGHAYFTATDAARSRTLPIEVWYPADESARDAAATGTPIEDLEPPGANHDALATLVAAAPDACTRKIVRSVADAPPAPGAPFPVVAFSHCHDCIRFSEAFVAERLASHGIAVVAPDHVGNTIFDSLAGNEMKIDSAFLAVREADLRFSLDVVLDASSNDVPAALRGRFDPSEVAAFGHSYGGATAGIVARDDDRVRSVLALAVPIESPLLAGTKMSDIHVPVAFLLAQEDNSITKLGNDAIEQNFADANPPVWLDEVADAGHWSFSDVCGLVSAFSPGCGQGHRMTAIETFTYLDNDVAREIAAAFVTAFFSRTLLADPAADAYLGAGHPADLVTAKTRP